MRAEIAQRRQIEGWGFSLFLHALLLSAIVPVFRHFPVPTHPEPFRWNVAFIESPQPAAPVELASDISSSNELLQTGEANEGTQMPLIRNRPSLVPQPTSEIDETIRAFENVRPKLADPIPTVSASALAESAPPAPSITEPTPVIQDRLPVQQDSNRRPRTMADTTPLEREPSTSITPSTEQETPLPAPSAGDVATVPAQSREPEQTSPASAAPTASPQPSMAQTDYSWLQRAVSRRLEELKRSSRPSLDDSSRLKVLVKAVVSNRGELMEAEVIKSSGLDRIDQEAMTLVQRAFPMPLDHNLDRQQIVMRIPITYSRD